MKDKARSAQRQGLVELEFWSGDSIRDNPPTVEYDAVMASDDGVKEWLGLIRRFGFSYISGVPTTPEATEKMMQRIAFIRHTHYGGFYDFTSDLAKGDTAYTQLGIGAHTDTTYFSDPAGLQLFHLLSHTGGEGGASQLVDGFAAAADLLREHPDAYETLSSVRVHAHASGNIDSSISPYITFPTFSHDPQDGHLVQVRWNVTDRGAIDLPLEEMDRWYDAGRKWTEMLRRREYWEQLAPGKPVIFDNWRVLHGRSAFTGKRRICGGYVNRDDWVSRFKITTFGREEVLRLVSQG
jgi:trimethyllysine dioxygenase